MLVTGARRPGTRLAYQAPWRKWVSWCGEREIDPTTAPVEAIANFLGEMHQSGLQYSTLNVYRSAISAYHIGIAGQHTVIKNLMKGIFNDRPPRPRYSSTWDVNTVLEKIKLWGDNSVLSMKQLSHKLAMLVALTTACRGSELKAMNPSTMIDRGSEVEFPIEVLTKGKTPSKPHLSLVLKEFEANPNLDVIKCLRTYLGKTRAWRCSEQQKSQLFLSFIDKHRSVLSCTLAGWLKSIMDAAGVDTTTYKAHSTRAASTSKAQLQGLSVEQIVKQGNWTKAKTFQKFYFKHIGTESYQNVVLRQ
jgi:site-specific recombinase XerD